MDDDIVALNVTEIVRRDVRNKYGLVVGDAWFLLLSDGSLLNFDDGNFTQSSSTSAAKVTATFTLGGAND